MKKLALSLFGCSALTLFWIPNVHAGDCDVPVEDVKDYTIQVTTDINFRDSIQGGEDDDCPESKSLGSFAEGQVLWVLGEIETGIPFEEDGTEFISWLYVQHPSTKEFGFIWGRYTEPATVPQDQLNHQEVVVKDISGTGEPIDESEQEAEDDEASNDDEAQSEDEPDADDSNTLPDIVGHPYEKAIRYLEQTGVVEGYPDGLYKADLLISRDEFTKIIVGAKLNGVVPTSSAADCFLDVKATDWFAPYVCYAKDAGFVDGYPNGNFDPGAKIKLVEAAKILVNVLGVPVEPETPVWYEVYIEAMQANHYLPDTFNRLDQLVTRGQMGEMAWRILKNITNQEAVTFNFAADGTVTVLTHEVEDENSSDDEDTPPENDENENENEDENEPLALCLDDHLPSSIDMEKVREAWLEWHNEARSERDREALSFETGLNYSASLWAQKNREGGNITHQRGDGVTMLDWFEEAGVVFEDGSSAKPGESLGVKSYTCNDSDCTDEVITAVEALFNAFMAEEEQPNAQHFLNIVNSNFTHMGMGLAIDEDEQLIYLTTHYGGEVAEYPQTCK